MKEMICIMLIKYLISHLDLLPCYELQSKLSGMSDLSDADIENNYVYRINSDYYNLEEFKS